MADKWYEKHKNDPEFKAKNRARAKAWSASNPDKRRLYAQQYYYKELRHVYKHGLTPIEYQHMLQEQNNRCAACGVELVPGRGTHIDHDHVSNKVRGVLCQGCNQALGNVGDSPTRLRALANYLEQDHD